MSTGILNGRAENGTRTRDPQLGKLMLYQLSYFRKCRGKYTVFFPLFRHLKGQKNDDSEKTPTFFRTDTAAQYECRREGKARPAPLQKFGSRQTRKDISARPCNETANYGTKT